jgi:hypothetical protein
MSKDMTIQDYDVTYNELEPFFDRFALQALKPVRARFPDASRAG